MTELRQIPGGYVTPDKVVIFSDTSWPMGGAEAMALLSAQVMADSGIPVIFIAGDAAEKCPLDRQRIEVLAFGDTPLLKRSWHKAGIDGVHNRAAQKFVERFIAERDTPATIYHLHNWSQIFSPAIFHALRPVETRLFLSAHDFALTCPNLSFSNFRKEGAACTLKPLSIGCVATNCDRRNYAHKLWRVTRSLALRFGMDFHKTKALIGIIHPFMIPWYERGGIPKNRLRIVRNPVKPFSKTRIKAELNRDVFFIGRLVMEKGPDLAAEAARQAGGRLRVIGDGDMRDSLRREYPEAIIEGWRTHDEIGELLKDARAVIVPSRLPETFTLVAHEAMRSGIPVITFEDVDGVEMAELGGAIVVPPRAASRLADALRQLDDDKAVKKMSCIAFQEGWRFSNTNESWRDTLLGIYNELLMQSGVVDGSASYVEDFKSQNVN